MSGLPPHVTIMPWHTESDVADVRIVAMSSHGVMPPAEPRRQQLAWKNIHKPMFIKGWVLMTIPSTMDRTFHHVTVVH